MSDKFSNGGGSGGGGGGMCGDREKKGYLAHLNTDKMNDARIAYDKALEDYRKGKDDVKRIIDRLLDCWEGEGKKEFDYDWTLLSSQLEDLMEVLLDLRKGLS